MIFEVLPGTLYLRVSESLGFTQDESKFIFQWTMSKIGRSLATLKIICIKVDGREVLGEDSRQKKRQSGRFKIDDPSCLDRLVSSPWTDHFRLGILL